MSDDLCKRLRRKKYIRTRWVEPVGEMDEVVCEDMADWDGVEAEPVNPDGPEAADTIERLRAELDERGALLRECEVKLRDAQGRYCSQQYASNLLSRIDTKGGE